MEDKELTFGEHKDAHQSMETAEEGIAFFKLKVELSEYAFEAFKAEALRRGLENIESTLEAIACDLEAGRGKGNPRVTRYK